MKLSIVLKCIYHTGDLLDNRYIELKNSEKTPEAGEGSFAKEDIPDNTLICLYGGLILNKTELDDYMQERHQFYFEKQWSSNHPQVLDDWKYRLLFLIFLKNTVMTNTL